jgi:hypothetical protein
VDFRLGIDKTENIERLIAGIRGELPVSDTPDVGRNQGLLSSDFAQPKTNLFSAISIDNLKEAFLKASNSLLSWPTTLTDGKWLERNQLDILKDRIKAESSSTTLLLGDPGSGKSALLAHLAHDLVTADIVILAIKADLLPTRIDSVEHLKEIFRLPAAPLVCIKTIAARSNIVLGLVLTEWVKMSLKTHRSRSAYGYFACIV